MPDNSGAFEVLVDNTGGASYLSLVTTDGAETMTFGHSTVDSITFTTDNNAANDIAITGGLTVTSAATQDSLTVTSSADTEDAIAVTVANTTGSGLDITDSTGDTASADGVIFIKNTDATLTQQQYLIQGRYTDSNDANADFLLFEDNAGTDQFVIGQDGDVTITGTADGTDAITITTGDILVSDGDLDISGGDANFTLDAADTLNVAKGATTSVDVVSIVGGGVTDAAGLDALSITLTASDGTDRTNALINGSLTSAGTGANDVGIGLLLDLASVANAASTNTAIKINSTAAWDNIIDAVGFDVVNTTGATTIAGSAEGTAALTLTAGDIVLTDGDITLTSGQIEVPDNSGAFTVIEDNTGGADYLALVTTDGAETMTFGHSTVDSITFTTDNNAAGDVAITGGLTVTSAATQDSLTVTSSADTEDAIAVTVANTTGSGLDITDSTGDTASADGVIFIKNTDATLTQQQYLIQGRYTDSNDANADFLLFEDNAGTDQFVIGQDGDVTITGTADGTDAITITTGDILVSDGDLDISGGDANFTLDAADTLNVAKGATTSVDVVSIVGGGVTDAAGLDALSITLTASDGTDRTNALINGSLTSAGTGANDVGIGLLLDLASVANAASTNTAIKINSTAAWDNIIDAVGFDVVNTTGATTIAGSAEGTAALTLTAGDIVLTDGDITLTSGQIEVPDNSGAFEVLVDNTGGASYLSSSPLMVPRP